MIPAIAFTFLIAGLAAGITYKLTRRSPVPEGFIEDIDLTLREQALWMRADYQNREGL